MEHLIANIQKFSVDDGPGIRTTVFLKGCPLHCIWCHNPECISGEKTLFWNELTCVHCGTCMTVCPVGALSLEQDRVVIDRARCNSCQVCTQACKVSAMSYYGRSYMVDELYEIILSDEPFYRTSGGGVTFSGGEPLLHAEYLLPLLMKLKAAGISMIFDTCGHISWKAFETVLPYADAFLFDIKGMEPDMHQENTGVSTELIHENLRRLSGENTSIFIRMPLIVGANAQDQQIEAAAEMIEGLGHIVEVDLLPYHNYGNSKYQRFGITLTDRELSAPDAGAMRYFKEIMEQHGLKAVVRN